MTANCPNCLKDFKSAWAVSRHLSQPLTSCLRWVDQLENAAQILQDSQLVDQHATPDPSESSSDPHHSRTPSPFQDFQMDLQVQADSDETVYAQGMNDSGYFYSDEGGMVGLESDLPGSVEEPLGSQASERPCVEHFRGAAKVYQRGQTFRDRFNMDPYTVHRKDNLYYPFASCQDWELGSFLLCSSLSMAAIDEFLGLELVKALPLSFRTAKELRGCAELLPPVPKWQYHIISTTHPTKQPLHFYWRDPLDCIESLFSHPLFANEIDVTPQRVYDTAEPWSMQSQLPDGAMLLGIILSSDKTNITNMTGGRVAHPLLISLANIKMATRNKASSHAFLLTALLPIAEFLHPVKWMQSVLEARLVHQCLDIVLEPLKQAARIGRMMSDPLGNLRYCFTPLASYIVNTPEACMLACVRGKTSPITMAIIDCDPLDIEGYFDACAAFRLSGIAQPFWHDWSLVDLHVFFTPEPLHHWYHQFYDHDVKWCLAAVGEQELDFRFSVLQPLMTFRHFKDGISKLKQVTGRAQRDMQCYIVALIADAAPRGVVIAICALMDFHYISQATTINKTHCQKILGALEEFHEHKQDVIACGARRGAKSNQVLDNWHIPKLELMQSVVPSIHEVGSLLQWSADTTEHAHITLIKDPADSSNNINYDAQICWFLDCREKCQNFQITTSIIAHSQSQSQASTSRTMDVDSDHHDSHEGPHIDESHLQIVLDDLWGPKHAVTDFFKKAEKVSSDIKVARPLRTFVGTTQNFHSLGGQRRALPDAPLPFNDLMVWFKVRVQQASYHSPSITPPALTVNVSPLSATWKYGHYDTAIFTVDDTGCEQWPTSGLKDTELQDKQILEDLKTAIKTRLKIQFTDLDNHDSFSLEYAAVVVFTSEERDFEVRAKFVYFMDTQDIHIMPPLPVHEQPAAHLAKAVNKFTEAIPYDKLLIDITMHLNHRIQNKDSTNIPDLHLTVTAQPLEDMESDEMVVAKLVSKWVGECGLSSDTNCMVRKLSITYNGHQDIDYAFIISFKERARWKQPKEGDITIQQLRSAPALDYEEFIPSCIKKSLKFGPVDIKSHTWIDISEVHYSVYKCGADGHFDFNNKNATTFAEGTLYPLLQMDNVARMLDNAAESLKGYIVSLMEGMGLEESAVQSARDSHPVFEPVWGAALNSISSAIYLTAYCRYLDWHNHKYDKRKATHVTIQQTPGSESSTQPMNTSPSSIPTTSSSSDLTTCPLSGATSASSSAGLSSDMQPECSAKKLKVQPEGEGSKGKPKKEAKAQASGKGKGKSC
ncbi:hypothetical protein EV702DRAFT_1045915 [Suillus placidus]|uniref:DUF6830 domain-containing protein n=1 Tax=Suillus placidus TaxID=48579 RepID=A0A9P6ZUC1_9AGAM|nr:hypothetical protein EV702DRAFT_1045915 [Suillus placidus]